ncbi:MAG: glycosyltransferase family 9 protein [Myxococcota bacterium]
MLLIRLGAMGDVVRTLPAAACLRQMHPGAHLAWLVEPAAAGVVEASGLVDETLVFPRGELVAALRAADALAFGRCLGGFLRRLRARRFELVLDFHGLLKSGLLARLSGAPVRYGFGRGVARELSDVFVNRHVQLPSRGVSRFDRNAALVAALVPDAELPAHPLLAASPIALARMVARLRISGREQASRFVLLHPGSSAGARHKRYATAGWAAVARRLAASGLGSGSPAAPVASVSSPTRCSGPPAELPTRRRRRAPSTICWRCSHARGGLRLGRHGTAARGLPRRRARRAAARSDGSDPERTLGRDALAPCALRAALQPVSTRLRRSGLHARDSARPRRRRDPRARAPRGSSGALRGRHAGIDGERGQGGA